MLIKNIRLSHCVQNAESSYWKLWTAKLSSHGRCLMKQVSVRLNKVFWLTPYRLRHTAAHKFHSKPLCYTHGSTNSCNLFKIRSRSRVMTRGRWWCRAVCLNISVVPSPAERNCVIMLDCFYDSNQGYCLCKQPAPLCAKEQLRYYTLAAENECTAIDWRDAG